MEYLKEYLDFLDESNTVDIHKQACIAAGIPTNTRKDMLHIFIKNKNMRDAYIRKTRELKFSLNKK
jgi:hypothetical protein